MSVFRSYVDLEFALMSKLQSLSQKRGVLQTAPTFCSPIYYSWCLLNYISVLLKGHFTKIYSIKGGGLKDLPGFRLKEFSCNHTACIQLNLTRRNPGKILSPLLLIE